MSENHDADVERWARDYLSLRGVPERLHLNILEAALRMVPPGEARTTVVVGQWMLEAAHGLMDPQEFQDSELSSRSDRWLLEAIYRKLFPVQP